MAIKTRLFKSDEDLDAEITMLDASLPRVATVLRDLDTARRAIGRASQRTYFGRIGYKRVAVGLRKADAEIRKALRTLKSSERVARNERAWRRKAKRESV